MPCNVQGYIYTANASTIVSGVLYITLQQDMVVGGVKVTPTRISYNLATATPAGYINVALYPTSGATPSGLSYFVEFDPTPLDTSKPISSKDGYWYNYWNVPDVASVSIGSFSSALRGSAANNYLPLSSPASSALTQVEYITGNKTLTVSENGKAVYCDGTARTIVLPTPTAGLAFSVHSNAATGNHIISPGASAKITGYGLNKALDANLVRTASAVGEFVKLVAGNATTWWVVDKFGNWA